MEGSCGSPQWRANIRQAYPSRYGVEVHASGPFLTTKKGRIAMQPFSKLPPGANPLWVSGEVFVITSWNQLASPRGFEPLSTA